MRVQSNSSVFNFLNITMLVEPLNLLSLANYSDSVIRCMIHISGYTYQFFKMDNCSDYL